MHAKERHHKRREAQENGEYAAAFWLCARCCKSLEALEGLSVTQELLQRINGMYQDTLHRLEAALAACCADFQAPVYAQVTS